MWQLDGTIASLQIHSLVATIDLQRPESGVAVRYSTDRSQASIEPIGHLWKLHLPGTKPTAAVADAWVRGHDLVAIYGSMQSQPSRAEVYWRVVPGTLPMIGMELVLSIQTDLLDDDPATCIESEIRATESWWLSERELSEQATPIAAELAATKLGIETPGSCVVRLPNQLSYIEMVHPSDLRGVEFLRGRDSITLRTRLFEDRLEKGVIRRGRIRGWLVPFAGDLSVAKRLSREFAHSEPPLTV